MKQPKPLNWVRLAHDDAGDIKTDWQDTYRAKVPGGWLVAVWATVERDETSDPKGTKATPSATTVAAGKRIPDGYWGGGITFVPDPGHGWKAIPHPKSTSASQTATSGKKA